MSPDRIEALRKRLRDNAAAIARQLLGEPHSENRREIRFGSKGGLVVTLAGDKAGLWHRFEDGEGDDLIALTRMELGDTFQQAIERLEGIVGTAGGTNTTPAATPRPDPGSPKLRGSPKLDAIIARSRHIAGTAGETWLRTRGCAVPADSGLRFLPATERYPWPAMLAIVTDFVTNERLTAHFTYLTPDGRAKAPIPKQRALLFNHQAGGVVRLTPDPDVTGHLGLAEGIETSLSVTAALGRSADWLPVWSTIDAGNMKQLPVVPGIERLSIFVDNDPPKWKQRAGREVNVGEEGQRAGRELARRWHAAGREVFIARPPAAPGGKGDWNGVEAAA